jgi:hypothetical protein
MATSTAAASYGRAACGPMSPVGEGRSDVTWLGVASGVADTEAASDPEAAPDGVGDGDEQALSRMKASAIVPSRIGVRIGLSLGAAWDRSASATL